LSDYLAIAGVSSTLRTLLLDRMAPAKPVVTIAPPDVSIPGSTGQRVNLYLYQISENGNLKNQEIPGEGHPGRFGRPPLSLNLYYLVTCYGGSESSDHGDLDAQQVLGDAMRVLYDYAIITPDLVITKKGIGTMGTPILDPSLRNEFEQIKVVLQPTSLDELTNLWTHFSEVNFRRSVTYEVSVVQIESQLPRRFAAPVKTRRLHVALPRRPEISRVYRAPQNPGDPVGDVRARIGDWLTIEGMGFQTPHVWVRLGELDPIAVAPVSDTRIQIKLPDDPRLQPGSQAVEVLIQRPDEVVQGGLDKGRVVADQSLAASNQSVFMLVPSIGSITPPSGPSATTQLTVNGSRLFKTGLKSYLRIGDVEIAVAASPQQSPLSITVPLTSPTAPFPPMATDVNYPVRIQVNGALSTEDVYFTLTP
jgi:hypothetical protein